MSDTKQSFLGCLLGGAIGDSFGSPHEGKSGPIRMNSGRPGPLTDDTQLSLATCEAIGDNGTIDAEAVAARFLAWFRHGKLTGLGASTLKALVDLDAGAHWALAGRRGDQGAGNGAAMRAAPLAFLLDPEDPIHRRTLGDICRITHHNDEAYVGALAIVRAVHEVTRGTWKPGDDLLASVANPLPDTNVRDGLLSLASLQTTAPLWEIASHFGCSGYVAESVPLAIYAVERFSENGFESTIQEAISMGGDTDTIASMAGQIAGAYSGFETLPRELYDGIMGIEEVIQVASAVAHRLS